jgi:hypothetical protein
MSVANEFPSPGQTATLPLNLPCRADIPVRRCGRLSSRPFRTPDWKVRATGRLESLPYAVFLWFKARNLARGILPLNRSASSPRPSPPFGMEERVVPQPRDRERRCSGFRGSMRGLSVRGILSLNREGTFNAQHSTSNVQGQAFGHSLDVGSSMLNVECSQGFFMGRGDSIALHNQPLVCRQLSTLEIS